MNGEETLTPRGKSQRVRRATKRYEGTITWEEAGKVINEAGPSNARSSKKLGDNLSDDDDDDDELGGGDEEEEGEEAEYAEEDAADQYEEGSESANGFDDQLSLMDEDEGDGNTSDEFVPEEERPSQGGRKGKVRADRGSLGSESEDEEFDSSIDDDGDEDLQSHARLHEPKSDGRSLFAQQAASMSITQRLERAKQRRGNVGVGHGGMEAPSDWREAGLKNRQAQREEMQVDNAEVEVEVEGEELQHLADIFAGEEEAGASIAQVERWQTALHQDQEKDEVEDEELDEDGFEEDMRTTAGFRRRRTQRDQGGDAIRRRAPREQTLSAPVRALISEANIAFIEPDLHKTVAKLKEVIKLEPAVRSAWATLALCFQELGEEEKALQSRIMEAHLTYRPIALWDELAMLSREKGYYEQAIYCLSKAITSSKEKDKVDVLDIMWERGQLLEEMGKPKRAAQSYMHMLQYRPQNQSIIRQIIPLLFQLDKLDRAIEILQRCEEWNMACFPDPLVDPAMMDAGPDDRNTYESSEVVTLADLLLRAGRPLEALHTIRRGARWLDGRGGETYWDDVLDDDREFDETRDDGDREDDYGRRVAFAPIHYLEPEFRFLLGVARARLGYGEEAARHFEIWQSDATIQDELEHYSDMAEEYMKLGQNETGEAQEKHRWFDLALRYTNDTINERQNIVTDDYDAESLIADYKRLAACYAGLGDSREAITWLKEVIKYAPDDFESTLRLAEAYEDTGDQDTAIELVTQVVKAKRDKQMAEARAGTEPLANDDTLTQSLSFFAEIQQRATRDGEGTSKQSLREKRKELERIRELESSLAWRRLKAREQKVFVKDWWSPEIDFSGDSRRKRYGDRESHRIKEERFANVSEWLSDAERLVTMFQSTPQLYPRNRTKRFSGVLRTKKKRADMVDSQASAILARLGDDVLEEGIGKDTYEHATFRGIKLEEWVTLIMQYAFVLTKVGEYETARAVVDQCIKSNVIWSDDKRKECMQLCLGSCALYAQDFPRVVEMVRTLTNDYQFHNEPLRMLLTLGNSTGSVSVAVLSQPHNLKYFLRRSRIHEAIAQGSSCKYKFTTKRWVVNSKLFGPSLRKGKVDQEQEEEDEEVGEEEGSEADEEAISEEDEEGETRTVNGGTAAASTKQSNGKDSASGSGRDVWDMIKDDPAVSNVRAKPPTRYDPANDMLYASMLLTSTNGVPSMGESRLSLMRGSSFDAMNIFCRLLDSSLCQTTDRCSHLLICCHFMFRKSTKSSSG